MGKHTAMSQVYYEYYDALTPDIPNDGRALFGVGSTANLILAGMRQQGIDFMINGYSLYFTAVYPGSLSVRNLLDRNTR